jgi:hypothetical protein
MGILGCQCNALCRLLFYVQMVATERVVHACALSILTYGALVYVEELMQHRFLGRLS